MAKLLLLGAGMVGRAIGVDLARDHHVHVADRDPEALAALADRTRITTEVADLDDPGVLARLCEPAELVVGAVPGFMGFRTVERVLGTGRDVVDISFFAEDCAGLEETARAHGAFAIVDVGLAPGLGNLALGHHDATMEVEAFSCYVGGLPQVRTKPYEYKAPFSPIDVIEEYTRPARFREHGRDVTRPALSEPEFVEFREVGTLEAFNTDGLRSLLRTMAHVPSLKEKTLRYPGHRDAMQLLADGGFFDETPVDAGGVSIAPRDLTSRLLLRDWRAAPDERELTVMRIEIRGVEAGRTVTHRYELYDEYDEETGVSSMARTTGYTCAAAVRLALAHPPERGGVYPPEVIGRRPGAFAEVRALLAERGVHLEHSVTAER